MKIAKDSVVSIEYTLTGPEGEVIDTSKGRGPLTYLQGAHNIIPGLENELVGKSVGDVVDVTVQPENGYGHKDPNLVQSVPRSNFKGASEIKPGMQFEAKTPEGPRVVTVTAVSATEVTVDANHALAGVVLNFNVTIVEVRAASPEEIQHGHAHGPGGHHH